MTKINQEVLLQDTSKGLTINEGISIYARLAQFASHPPSTKKLNEAKAKSETPQGKVDKNGKALKFSRDLESDWTVKNDVAYFGSKGHAPVDVKQGFILANAITDASHHDSPNLPLCFAQRSHTKEPIKKEFMVFPIKDFPNRIN